METPFNAKIPQPVFDLWTNAATRPTDLPAPEAVVVSFVDANGQKRRLFLEPEAK